MMKFYDETQQRVNDKCVKYEIYKSLVEWLCESNEPRQMAVFSRQIIVV